MTCAGTGHGTQAVVCPYTTSAKAGQSYTSNILIYLCVKNNTDSIT